MQVTSFNTLARPLKSAAKFVYSQEQASGLSTTRFIQDTGTCLVPKAVFARSKADFAENSLLELSESALVYFAPAFIGEKIARKAFSKNLSPKAKNLVSKPAVELLKTNSALNKKILPAKAAIALSAMIIPLTEFTLNYFKNLFTLKTFKKADFKRKKKAKIIKKGSRKVQRRISYAQAGFLPDVWGSGR